MGIYRHPKLRDILFGDYQTPIHFGETTEPALDTKALRRGAYLGLVWERRYSSHGDLAAARPALLSGT